MKFDTVKDAFNHYRTATPEAIEKRAAAIKGTIENDPEADVTSLNIEIQGLKQAQANMDETTEAKRSLDLITSAHMGGAPTGKAEKAEGIDSPEYRSAFFKTLLGRRLSSPEQAAMDGVIAERRADSYSTTTNTGAVIPTETLNEVVSKARKQGGLMSVSRAFAVPSNVSIPVGTPTAAATWNTEGKDATRENPDVGLVKFASNEIIKCFSVSASVRKMSVPAFESYLTDELTSSVMACIADGLVNGTGSGQGTGVLSGVTWDTTNSATFAKTGSIAYADVCNLVAMLKRGYSNGATFVMSNATLYKQFYGMVDANKRPVFIADPKDEGIGKILTFPVVIDDYIADDVVLFGNFDYMGYNMVDGITVESSTQSSFTSGRVDYRAMAIADTKPIVPEAFVKLSRATA